MSKSIVLITIGPEYNGGMFLYHTAEKSADIFESVIKSKCDSKNYQCKIISLRGSNANANNIINTISSLSNLNETDCKRIIIFYSGHGNSASNKEYWQTPNGNVDQIKISQLINELKPLVIIISDSCSSEHMVNSKFIKNPYISLGATMDDQDAMMSGDGGLFTLELCKIINGIDPNFTFADLFYKIFDNKIDIETFSIKYSSDKLLDEKFLP